MDRERKMGSAFGKPSLAFPSQRSDEAIHLAIDGVEVVTGKPKAAGDSATAFTSYNTNALLNAGRAARTAAPFGSAIKAIDLTADDDGGTVCAVIDLTADEVEPVVHESTQGTIVTAEASKHSHNASASAAIWVKGVATRSPPVKPADAADQSSALPLATISCSHDAAASVGVEVKDVAMHSAPVNAVDEEGESASVSSISPAIKMTLPPPQSQILQCGRNMVPAWHRPISSCSGAASKDEPQSVKDHRPRLLPGQKQLPLFDGTMQPRASSTRSSLTSSPPARGKAAASSPLHLDYADPAVGPGPDDDSDDSDVPPPTRKRRKTHPSLQTLHSSTSSDGAQVTALSSANAPSRLVLGSGRANDPLQIDDNSSAIVIRPRDRAPPSKIQDGLVMFSDGSYIRKVGGAGIAYKIDDQWHGKSFPLGKIRGANEAEMHALHRALVTAHSILKPGHHRLLIFTDSEAALHEVQQAKAGRGMGFTVIRDIILAEASLVQRAVKVEFSWVKGHNVSTGNELADHLAGMASQHCLDRDRRGIDAELTVELPITPNWLKQCTVLAKANTLFKRKMIHDPQFQAEQARAAAARAVVREQHRERRERKKERRAQRDEVQLQVSLPGAEFADAPHDVTHKPMGVVGRAQMWAADQERNELKARMQQQGADRAERARRRAEEWKERMRKEAGEDVRSVGKGECSVVEEAGQAFEQHPNHQRPGLGGLY